MPIAKAFCEFHAGAEFSVKTKIKTLYGVVITTTEAGGENPVMTQLQMDQHTHGGIERIIFSATEEKPRSKSIESESGAVFYAPERLEMAIKNLGGAGAQAEQGRIVRKPLMRGMGGKRLECQQA